MSPGRAACVGSLLATLAVAASLEAQTFTLQATADTSLRKGTPNRNLGNDRVVQFFFADSRVLLRFDQPAIASAVGSGRLVSASLELFVRATSGDWGAGGRPVEVHRLTSAWTEAKATWNCAVDNRPANNKPNCTTPWNGGTYEEDSTDTVVQTRDGHGWVKFDVTADVAAFLAGAPNQGWLLKRSGTDPGGQVEYVSREGAPARRPRLVLVVETAANDSVAPSLSITSPSRPILVNEASPAITLEYADGGSGVNPSTLQVLVDGQDVTPTCAAGAQAASCHPAALAAGSHKIQAALRDWAGNPAQASFHFQLLLDPDFHLAVFEATGDTGLRREGPNRNFGAEPLIRVREGGLERSLIQFDPQSLSTALAGAKPLATWLEIHIAKNGRNWGPQGRTAGVYRATVPWMETEATWNCPVDANPADQKPDCTPPWNGGSFAPAPTSSVLHTRDLAGWVSFDVTADLAAFASGTPNYGWLLKKTDETESGRVEYDSREGTPDAGPRLVVVFQKASTSDTTPPKVVITTPAEGSFVASATPTVTASYSDDGSGVNPASVRLLIDGHDSTSSAEITAVGVTFTPEALASGRHSVSVSVSDHAGNLAQASRSFTVDTVPPNLQLVLPSGQTQVSETSYALSILYSDAFSGVEASSLAVTVNSVDISSSCIRSIDSATCSIPTPSTGSYGVIARIHDLAGNLAEASGSLNVVVDLAPPVVTLLAPQDGSLVRSTTITVNGSVSDDHVVSAVTVNGKPVTLSAGAFSTQMDLTEGINGIVAVAVDSAGKQSFATATVTLDTQPPTLTIENPKPGALTNQSSVRLNGNAADENGIDRIEIAGVLAPLAGGEFSQTLQVQDGPNNFVVQAFDRAGNSTATTVTITRFALPEVTITAPTDLSWIAKSTIDVAGTVSPGVTNVSVNGALATLTGSSFMATGVPLLEGGNILTATAVDAQGHMSTASINVVRDLTAPRLEIYGPSSGSIVTQPTVAVFGLVNDIVDGTVNASEVSVLVNDQVAEVTNRSFLLPALPLTGGLNEIVVTATDKSGNRSEARVNVHRETASGRRVEIVSGDRQAAVIGTELPFPLIVRVLNSNGGPAVNVPVLFKVSGNNGSFSGGRRQLAVATDAGGQAEAQLTLGTHVGVASQRVDAVAVGYGSVVFLEDALPGAAVLIVVDSGDQQVGVAGQELPRPMVSVVTDTGHNRLEGVPVKLQVVKGAGKFRNDLQVIVVNTDSDGRAIVPFRLDPQEGTAANVVEARIGALPEGPFASFTATGWAAGDPALTVVKGIVLDNTNLPVPGVTIRIKDTGTTVQTDAQGIFRIQSAPVGTFYLIVDGSTTTRPRSWPDLELVMTTVPGRENDLGMPIYLLPLNQANGILIDETHGGTITLPEIPGFALEIQPGSVTFAGGSKSGLVSVTPVHADKVPMVPNFGQQPRFIVTIQPAGARFDPPARLILPNVEGLAPGEVTEFYSFDHDLGHFVSIGPATVSNDGTTISSNLGVGIVKGGWHCGGNPSGSGTIHNCSACQKCVNNRCEPDATSLCACSTLGDSCTEAANCKTGKDLLPKACDQLRLVTSNPPKSFLCSERLDIPEISPENDCGAGLSVQYIGVTNSRPNIDLNGAVLKEHLYYKDPQKDDGCKFGELEDTLYCYVGPGNLLFKPGLRPCLDTYLRCLVRKKLPQSFNGCTEVVTQDLYIESGSEKPIFIETHTIRFDIYADCTGTADRK